DEPQGKLPAHVGLPVERSLAGFERASVQRAAGAARESGPVEEDARVADEPGDQRAVRGTADRATSAHRGPTVLPLLVGQPIGRAQGGVGVVLVDEVGAVAAASL